MAHIPYILACHLQIDADPDLADHFDADADLDPDPAYHFNEDSRHHAGNIFFR
jgi:hypothetical protein